MHNALLKRSYFTSWERKRIMRKRKIALALMLAVFGTSVVGCSKNTENELTVVEKEDVSLKLWGAESDLEFLQEIADGFVEENRENANINITLEATAEDQCKNLLLENVNEGPDVYTFADDQLQILAASGVLEKVDYPDEVKNNNVEGSVLAASVKDDVYAYPLTADNGYFMYYNKKYLKEEDVKTLDGILSVAEQNGKKMVMDWSSGWYLYSFFGNTGMKLGLNGDGVTNYCDFNKTSGKIKGTDVAKAMYDISRSAGFQNGGDEALLKGAKDGSVIAGISGTWNAKELEEIWGKDYAAVKLPTYTCAGQQVQMASYAGYKMVGVNAYSEQKEWAEKFALYLTNEENQKLRFEKRSQGPSNKNAGESELVKESVAIQAILQQSEHASLQRVGERYWGAMSEFGLSFFNGEINPSNFQAKLDKLVKNITAKITDEK